MLQLPGSSDALRDLVKPHTLQAIAAHSLLPPYRLAALPARQQQAPRQLRWVGKRRSGSGPTVGAAAYVYNPSVLDRSNLLVRLSSLSWCTMNSSHTSAEVKASLNNAIHYRFSLTLWLQGGVIRRAYIPRSEDARAFRLHGAVHAVFKRFSRFSRFSHAVGLGRPNG